MKKFYSLGIVALFSARVLAQTCNPDSCPNFVVNGDFNGGNTAFTTTLIYDTVGNLPASNHFFIHDDAYGVYGNWCGVSPDSSAFMIVDGSNIPGTVVWEQTIPAILPSVSYDFCLLMTNLDINHTFTQPDMRFTFLDQNGDTLLNQTSGAIPPLNTQVPPFYVWTTLSYSFTTLPTSSTVTIRISQLNFAGGGNDYGMEDITLHETNCSIPVANFAASDSVVCTEGCLDFIDLSTNLPTSWMWIFQGASNDTVYVQNPVSVCYVVPGVYDITLITWNQFGSDTLYMPAFVTVTSGSPGAELLTNGDFTNGNTGFTTSLTFLTGGLPYAGSFFINTDANAAYGGWAAVSPSASNFMIVDGSTMPGALVWSEIISPVSSGSTYQFSFQVTNLDVNHSFAQPSLDIEILDQNMNVALTQTTGNIAPQNSQVPPVYIWTPFMYTFTAPGGASSFTINFTQASGTSLGYDFGIDDISLKEITCFPTSVADETGLTGFSVYPNPTAGDFTLSISAEKSSTAFVTMINMLGESVGTSRIGLASGENKVSSQQLFPRKSLPGGLYFLQVIDGTKNLCIKIAVGE